MLCQIIKTGREKAMKERKFGKTGRDVSEIGFGAWAIGGSWGDVPDTDARAALHAALDAGTTFLDTADVYGDGRSERFIAQVLKERSGPKPFVATKAGRRLSPHTADGYNKQNLTAFIERSLTNLATIAWTLCNCIARRWRSIIVRKCSAPSTILWLPARSAITASRSRRSRKR
jgi:predicted aldo/keto reductase-like oxidoreductase